MYLEKAKRLFSAMLAVPVSEVLPCTVQEVQALHAHVGLTSPCAYDEFLLWMGQGAGIFLQGTDVFYHQVWDLRDGATELLQENNVPATLPDDAFVFYMHQGYQFMFFHTQEGGNPAVYYYNEGEDHRGFVNLYPSYSSFLETEIRGHARLLREMAQRRARTRSTDRLDGIDD